MASSTTTSSDLGAYASAATPTMDDLLRSIYPAPPPPRTAEEVWRDISADRKVVEEMTLEDFLAKEGAVREEDVRVSPTQFVGIAPGGGFLPGMPAPPQQMVPGGVDAVVGMSRGKRRAALLEPPVVDRVVQQRQRRMIKNRESAARSRERKQAYTVELESLVTRLEDENAQLLKQMEAEAKERLMKLMETVIPVTKKQKPPRRLRRTFSMSW